jgi:hypothetical protein
MTANHRRQYKGGSGARVIAVTGLAAVGTLGIGLGAAGSLGATTGTSPAPRATAPAKIYACYSDKTDALSYLNYPTVTKCPSGETRVSWNTVGPQGAQGARGPKRAQGAQGAQGVRGPQGAQGPQGSQGPPGPQGSAGPQGGQGPKGSQGARGARGRRGARGTPGSQGPQGSAANVTATDASATYGTSGPIISSKPTVVASLRATLPQSKSPSSGRWPRGLRLANAE